MDKVTEASSNSKDDSLDLEIGDQRSTESEPEPDSETETRVIASIQEAAVISRKKSIFEKWANTFVMVPFTILTNLFAALWAINGNRRFFDPGSFYCRLFFFVVMINFYASIIGIILWRVFPMLARGFHLVAFFCALLSLNLLFDAILPSELHGMPWILMGIVVLTAFVLIMYKQSSQP